VVWNDRVLLFWLRVLKQTPLSVPQPPAAPSDEPTLKDQTLTKVKQSAKDSADQNVKITIQAALCWSEYYNGKWQTAKTSDFNAPVDLGSYGPHDFERSNLHLSSDEIPDGLRITISGGFSRRAFLLYNTHSLPVPTTPPRSLPYGKTRALEVLGGTLTIDYGERVPDVPSNYFSRDVLSDYLPKGAVQPNHPVADIWDAPFFFEDRRNVFYVTTAEQPVWVRDHLGIGVAPNPGVINLPQIPPLVVPPIPRDKPKPWVDGGPIGPEPGVIDPAPMLRFVTEDAYIRQGLATTVNVVYGDRQIGPSGAVANVNGRVVRD
jgi:hypothetical protein